MKFEPTATFGLVSIRRGRAGMRKITKKSLEVPVTITGQITGPWGNDDGIDQEFAMDITSFKIGKLVRVPKDNAGRPWALAKHVCAGDRLQCDAGFTCIKPNTTKIVRFDANKPAHDALYITCKDKGGRHYLSGQLGYTPETMGAYVGLYPVK